MQGQNTMQHIHSVKLQDPVFPFSSRELIFILSLSRAQFLRQSNSIRWSYCTTLFSVSPSSSYSQKLLLQQKKHLPPSPTAFPILGHLYLLKKPLLKRTLEGTCRPIWPNPISPIRIPLCSRCFLSISHRRMLHQERYHPCKEKKMVRFQRKREVFLQGLIDEHRRRMSDYSIKAMKGERKKTLVDALLCLQQAEPEYYYSDDIIKGLTMVINHGVPFDVRRRVETAAMEFYDLPLEEKRKLRRDEVNPLGYSDTEHTKNVRDWKEVFDFTVVDPTVIPLSDEPDD